MNLTDAQSNTVFEAVVGYLNGCPASAIRNAINLVAEAFIRDTGGIVVESEDVPARDDGVYHIDAPFGGKIATVRQVVMCGSPLAPTMYEVTGDESGCVNIRVNRSGPLRIRATWFPGFNTKQLPEQWFRSHVKALADGTLSMLLLQSSKPWFDEATGANFTREFDNDKRDALYELRAAECPGGRLSVFDPTYRFVPGV